jgi:hypothetical protein
MINTIVARLRWADTNGVDQLPTTLLGTVFLEEKKVFRDVQ